jgi:protein-S-isoprenylcysteine O-methyltransferase Ste14
MYVIDYVIYGLWVLFWLAWLAAALTAKRAARSRMRQFVGLRVVLFVIVVLVSRSGAFKGHHTIVSNPILQGIGMGLFLAGLGLALWARVYLGRNWGTPMSEKVDAELVTTGPYRYIRNPIYSGIILAAVGTAVAVSWFWLVAVALMGVLHLQRNRRGAHHGAPLSERLSGIQALDQDADSFYVLSNQLVEGTPESLPRIGRVAQSPVLADALSQNCI